MATKFSDFTAQATTGTTFVVGYDGTTNTRYTQDQLTNFVLNGDLTANANVGLATYNLGFTNGKVGVGLASPLYTFETRATVASNWVARIMNESSTGHGLILKVDSNSSGKVTFATQNSIGYTMTVHNNGNVAIGKNNLTGPSARLHIKGAGTSNATTAFLVEDSSGNDIIKVLDNRTVKIGYNANQITTESGSGGIVKLNNTSGDPLFSASVIAGSTAKINVYGGYYRTFEYGANTGLVFTNQAGFHVAQDASSMLTCISSTKGMLPPRMTTAQRDAINSGTFTTGLTLYNTTTNKLQFYNGSAWQDAAGGDNIYTADGTINEDRVITVGHDATTKASYTTTFESTKTTAAGSSNTRNTALGNRLILTETVTLAPTGYSSSRGAGISLTHNSDGDDVTGTINVQSINSGTSDYYGRSQMGFRTNTGFVFSQEGTAPSNWTGDALIVRDRLASNQSKSLRYHPSQSDGGRLKLVAPNAKTSQILLASSGTDTFYRYISGNNNGALTLGRKLTSGSEEAYITCNGIGNYSGNIAVGVNQGTPAATLHVTGSGATNATTSLIVENSSGNDILNIKDDGAFALGRGATPSISQSVVIGDTATANQRGISIGYSTTSGDSGVTIGWDAGVSFATGRNINIGYTARASGLSSILLTAANGNGPVNNTENYNFSVYMTSQSTPDFRVIGNEGMIPPSITTTVRDAISSPASGSTIYNTTDNKLQFYNGSDWTDAGGGGDSIYTADGTLSGNRTVTVPGGGSITFSYPSVGYFYVGSSTISSHGQFQAPAAGRFQINSYSTVLKQNHLLLYATTYITGTTTGFVTVSGTTGTAHSINARLGVIGKSTTSTTDYAFRVQQSDNTDLFTLRDDGAFALGKSASITSSTPNSNVVLGTSALCTSNDSVVIGKSATTGSGGNHNVLIGADTSVANNTSFGVAIGRYASSNSNGIAIGYSSAVGGNGIAIGRDAEATANPSITINASGSTAQNTTANSFAVHMSDASTPDFRILHNGNSYITGTGNFGVGLTNPTDRIQAPTTIGVVGDGVNAGKLKLYCEAGTAHHVAIEGPAHSGGSTYTIKLPASAPSAGQVLASDANGNLSWKSPHQLDFSGLPTSDPGVEGRLYNDEGTVKVSIP